MKIKTEQTKSLEMAIWKATYSQGTFGCFEVTIGWFGKERVDYMTYNTKGEFRCYEVKITKADFHSPCNNSFVGDFNYYVMPIELYEEVKEEIPAWVGVYASHDGKCAYIARKAKRRDVEIDRDILKNSMIRSLCREVNKQIKSGNPLLIESKNREIQRLEKEKEKYMQKYWDLKREVEEKYGSRWNKMVKGELNEGTVMV